MARFKNPVQITRCPKAELVTIGTELLTGSVLNSNAHFLSGELTQLGFQVSHQTSCRDEACSIQDALRLALARSDVIFISGGLGPTPDDITRDCLAHFFNVPLVLSRAQYRQIQRYYRQKKKAVPHLVRQEALFPKNARPVFNRYGIALGFVVEERGRLIVVLPGVPGELIRLFRAQIRPLLKRKFPGLRPQSSLIVKTVGLSEPTIMKRLGRSFFEMGPFEFGIYPDVGEVAIRIYAKSENLIGRLKRHLVRTLGEDIYSLSDDKIEAVIGKRLVHRGENISIAESCTGGQVAERMTRIAGASRYFTGAMVAYQNRVKLSDLGVTPLELRQNGAVSREVALSMAREIRKRFLSTLGIGVTGIAGPTGGTTEKPVGLVYIAIASSKYHRVWKEQFQGDRAQIQNRATKKVLEYLWRWLQK